MNRAPWLLLLAAVSACPAAEPALSTGCRYVPERLGDFAWENDRVAFRVYGPPLRGKVEDSGVDCWLKRVPYPIIDSWYAGHQAGRSYHQDRGEGYDPYHVGSSRGCGGTALWIADRLVTAGPYETWRIDEQTPGASAFTLTYRYPAEPGVEPIEETKRIRIVLGEHFYHATSTFSRGGTPVVDLPVAVGLTLHDGKAQPTLDPAGRWLSTWEIIDGQGLGTGLALATPADLRVVTDTVKDRSHALALLKSDAAGRITFRAGYGWAKAGIDEARWRALVATP